MSLDFQASFPAHFASRALGCAYFAQKHGIFGMIHLTKISFLDFTWHCSTAAAGLVTLDFIFNTAFYTVKWVFSPQLHFPHSSIFLTAEGNRTCKFDQILWPMLSSTKISCLTGVLNPGLLCVKPRLYHWAKLPLLKMRGKTVRYGPKVKPFG